MIAGIGQGDYRVTLAAIPSGAYVKAIQLGGIDVLRNGFRIDKAPEAQLDVLLNLDGATLEGVAINERSEPVINATVALVPDVPSRDVLHLYRSTTTNASGTFEVKGIAPGRYKVFGWEAVSSGAWQDPEFIRDFETQGTPVTFTDGSRQQVRVSVSSQTRAR